jgi:flagellar basal-body rod modification protein FlgD
MTDPIGSTTNAATAGGLAASSEKTGLTALAERDTFLKMLVAQVQNQDPLSPQDPIEFVSQLTQFSQLETLLTMRTSLEGIEQSLAATAPSGDDPVPAQAEGL